MWNRRIAQCGKINSVQCLTEAGIAAENFPFCTIEPNSGIVSIPDTRLDKLAELVAPEKLIPTTVEFTDIAGLVAGGLRRRGAWQPIPRQHPGMRCHRPCSALFRRRKCHACANTIDPAADIDTINTELALADLETVEKSLDRVTVSPKAAIKTHNFRSPYLKK